MVAFFYFLKIDIAIWTRNAIITKDSNIISDSNLKEVLVFLNLGTLESFLFYTIIGSEYSAFVTL
jgi:hypothetical protein